MAGMVQQAEVARNGAAECMYTKKRGLEGVSRPRFPGGKKLCDPR